MDTTMDDQELWLKVRSMEEQGKKFELGPSFSDAVLRDPKHLLFTLSRYKFAAKMIQSHGAKSTLEVGWSEGTGTLLLSQVCEQVTATDFDAEAIRWAKENYAKDY